MESYAAYRIKGNFSMTTNSSNIVRQILHQCNQTGTSEAIWADFQIYISFVRYFVTWFVPLLVIFGEIGTLLCLIVLLRRRTGTTETRLWFVALSLSDMYTLGVGLTVFYFSKIYILFQGMSSTDIRLYSKFNCYFINGLVYFGLFVSTWIQVGISLLRVISIKSKQFTKKPQPKHYVIALVICVSICLLVTMVKVGFGMLYGTRKPCPISKVCSVNPDYLSVFFYSSLLFKVLIPTTILFTCSIIIINNLNKFQRQFSHDRTTPNSGSKSSSFNSSMRRKRVKQKQISYTLLGMNLTFLLLTLPFELIKLYHGYKFNGALSHNLGTTLILEKSLNILLYTNNATNWLFYFMLGKRFRKNVLSLLCNQRRINCHSFWLTVQRINTTVRSNKRTRTTHLPPPPPGSKDKNYPHYNRTANNKAQKTPARPVGINAGAAVGVHKFHVKPVYMLPNNYDGSQDKIMLNPQLHDNQNHLNLLNNNDNSPTPPFHDNDNKHNLIVNRDDDLGSSLLTTEPKFHCTYPGVGPDFFPKFY